MTNKTRVVLVSLWSVLLLAILVLIAMTYHQVSNDLGEFRPTYDLPQYIICDKIPPVYTQKKRLAFLFTGNARTSPWSSPEAMSDSVILDSYKKYVFTEELRERYDFDVYVSTDRLSLKLLKEFFGAHLINLHNLDDNFYAVPPHQNVLPVPKLEHCLERYASRAKHPLCTDYPGSIHQHYKVLDAFALLLEHTPHCTYDFIVRVRLDTQFTGPFLTCVQLLEDNPTAEVVMDHDWFAVGRPSIMYAYCTGLLNKYGNYFYDSNEKCSGITKYLKTRRLSNTTTISKGD